jgi:uncharacterized protein with HEPN domain
MSSRDIELYIVDILIAIDKISRYIHNTNNASEFVCNEIIWDATIRELEVIGEATKYLLNANLLEQSYRRVVDFRNQITHGYFGIDENIVWDVVINKLPQYKNDLLATVQECGINLQQAILTAKKDYQTHSEVVHFLDQLSLLPNYKRI